jgi:hypothetical protein
MAFAPTADTIQASMSDSSIGVLGSSRPLTEDYTAAASPQSTPTDLCLSAFGVVTSEGIPAGGWAQRGVVFNQRGFGDAGGAVVAQPMLRQEKVTANHGSSVGAHRVKGFQPRY